MHIYIYICIHLYIYSAQLYLATMLRKNKNMPSNHVAQEYVSSAQIHVIVFSAPIFHFSSTHFQNKSHFLMYVNVDQSTCMYAVVINKNMYVSIHIYIRIYIFV